MVRLHDGIADASANLLRGHAPGSTETHSVCALVQLQTVSRHSMGLMGGCADASGG